jgi:hypothetical protein
MANPVIGDEEDTSEEDATLEKDSEETEEEQTVDKDQAPTGEIKEEVIPYHKDKRWIEMYEKAKRFDELEQEQLTLKEKLNKLEQMKSDEPLKVPESFKRLFGDDEEVYRIWKSEQDEREKSLRADILREIQEGKQKEIESQWKEEEEWGQYFDAEIESLKEDGFTFDDERLKKFVLDNDITDSRGVYDLKKGLLKMMNATKSNPARKQIADMTGGGKSSEQEVKNYATDDDFRGPNRPW